MNKFNVGDRVAIYNDGDRLLGVITSGPSSASGNYRVDSEHQRITSFQWFHPRQLRKLVKKEQRRVWVNPNPTSNGSLWKAKPVNNFVSTEQPRALGWIEFVEVKKK